MIFYFTGTGNSLWAAKEIGKELNQPVENIITINEQIQNIAQKKDTLCRRMYN